MHGSAATGVRRPSDRVDREISVRAYSKPGRVFASGVLLHARPRASAGEGDGLGSDLRRFMKLARQRSSHRRDTQWLGRSGRTATTSPYCVGRRIRRRWFGTSWRIRFERGSWIERRTIRTRDVGGRCKRGRGGRGGVGGEGGRRRVSHGGCLASNLNSTSACRRLAPLASRRRPRRQCRG